jgi:hypothetical protein
MGSRPVAESFLNSRVHRTCRRPATPPGAVVSVLLGRAADVYAHEARQRTVPHGAGHNG